MTSRPDPTRQSIVPDRKRSSIQCKRSFTGDGNGRPGQGGATRIGGQLVMCVIGSVIGIAICIWLAFFSHDEKWRRILFASGAAVCAIIFGLLAIKSLRTQPVEPEPLPDLSHRRSTIGGRATAKRSISTALHSSGAPDDAPSHVVVVGESQRSTLLSTNG